MLYACAPLGFVARQAGGLASDGHRDILEMKPTELRQRTPLFIGARAAVEEINRALG